MAHSLATALVTAGSNTSPHSTGTGPVGDRAATVFARRLYPGLADRAAMAVAAARPAGCCWNQGPQVRADWHLARLWLGTPGGGPIVAAAGNGRW